MVLQMISVSKNEGRNEAGTKALLGSLLIKLQQKVEAMGLVGAVNHQEARGPRWS